MMSLDNATPDERVYFEFLRCCVRIVNKYMTKLIKNQSLKEFYRLFAHRTLLKRTFDVYVNKCKSAQ